MVEVDEIHKANDIRVLEDRASIRLLKTGLYDFDVPQAQVRVFKGQALLREGDRHVKVGGAHEVILTAPGHLKSRKFDKKRFEGSLYRFSRLRSDYLSEANANASQTYAYYGGWGPGWYAGGWYWDPGLNGFTFMPPDGVFYSPFGFGFYSPFVLGEPFAVGHHFERFRDFDDHPGFAIQHGPGPRDHDFDVHPDFAHRVAPSADRDHDTARPPASAFRTAPAVAPRVGGFARGRAMSAVHPGGFAFHGGGFHGDDDGGGIHH